MAGVHLTLRACGPGQPRLIGRVAARHGVAWVDLTMANMGTGKLFEDAGFIKAADTTSLSGGFPRVVMRLDLR